MTKISLVKSIKIEPFFNDLSLKIRQLPQVDTILSQNKCISVIVNKNYLDSMRIIHDQRNSKYLIYCSADEQCQIFGPNKILAIRDLILADGIEVGLCNNKNINELINEMKGIESILKMSQKQFIIRWIINVKHGKEYINNCVEAIKIYNKPYNAIKLILESNNIDLVNTTIKEFRELTGKTKEIIKIKCKYNEELLNLKNTIFEFPIEDLI